LEVPFLHLFFKHFIWFRIDEIFHDFLPLLEVKHGRSEELINVEQVYDLTSIWFDQIWIDLMSFFNDTCEKICDEFVHNEIVLLLVGLAWLLVIPEKLDRHTKNNLH
jgi:hypothetical protein